MRREDLADELFIEAVFGSKPFIPRAEWETNVLTNVKWMFDSREMRTAIYNHLTKLLE